ncbi:sugar ABC transporter permease [Corynebacterium sp. ES2794-CONJ1]|nr:MULTISPECIES: sugar ABC transporter permease [unclassified Corynebacterium]MCS4489663.1 sugar ABC transporter permease [Corynebacterium sp. ES2775-CONJ]MCS4491328.1 sugar ABC transporter permease [Corynebacterium sp. ES2715-CONJ3]MCS4531575.1 sugar ABC transporter permease [Corynebacterium sp. ES2730-CONJ]MCU9518971.1 sugar ABC transporter permease [Corynebacterium sp. ES2794-CONJ1]
MSKTLDHTDAKMTDQRAARRVGDILSYALLGTLSIIWVMPIIWIFANSFNKNTAPYSSTFFPTEYTFDNYIALFTERDVLDFPRMFLNTFVIAVFTMLISVFFVLIVSFSLSRMRFRFRKVYMNLALTLGMFPGIMAVVAIYFILKAMGLTGGSMTNIALIIVYSAGSGMGFYIMKGYMDTIPKSLDEAAYLDGCSRWQVFYMIILPIAKPMIVYQAIIGFLVPWLDFVLAKAIARTQDNYTVALGLWKMLEKEYIHDWFARFAAGAVCVSIPIVILFIVMQRYYQESMAGSVKG